MADIDETNEGHWVEDRVKVLTPAGECQPDLTRARHALQALDERAAIRVRRRWIAATACLGLLVLPWPRAVAQQLWQRLTLTRVEVVQTTREDVPSSLTSTLTMEPQPFEHTPVRDLAEAQSLLGFRPALPPAGLLDGSPTYSVVKSVSLSTRPLKTAEIKRALAAVGASDLEVPAHWEGTTLTAEAGPVLIAEYDGVEIMQSAPFRMMTPAGFEFGRLLEMTFRVFGRSAPEARTLAATFVANPALIMHFPEHEPVRDVPLRAGRGILVGDPNGPDDICFFWNTPDHIYIVSARGMSEQKAVALADSIGAAAEQ